MKLKYLIEWKDNIELKECILKLAGNFMYSGNVEPNNIPAWEISDKDGRKVYYPQYQEGEAFKKI